MTFKEELEKDLLEMEKVKWEVYDNPIFIEEEKKTFEINLKKLRDLLTYIK